MTVHGRRRARSYRWLVTPAQIIAVAVVVSVALAVLILVVFANVNFN